MDDAEYVCPLCCEELDISDREFYPCKCGYQVCMWCWHRIRESESGLCPACRTPYGEDPHQFSAVDVEEVLRANKEREAALKKQRQQDAPAVPLVEGEAGGTLSTMEVPKDRSQLANMRVIRRNLVYAVGLPTNIASEDTLRKPEYFGQYGKISKIVINRAVAGDAGRRASASAYVTFAHKEDTLSCILALDGFYLENRNIRASYGTSKYCSAFIKNVRCNNPECTYLHEMGAAEDTFTKQEIQAGYVTSGRDVLARQQQILSEQLRQGTHTGTPRKRVGGGGPSGTGRASANPVFPPPEYDEPAKPAPTLVPAPVGVSRPAVMNGSSLSLNPSNIAAKLGRSTSGGRSPTLTAMASGTVAPALLPGATAAIPPPLRSSKSAASIVAGVHSVKSDDSPPHTTLTPLTPLKRAPKTNRSTTAEESKVAPLRAVGKSKPNGVRTNGVPGTIGGAASQFFPDKLPSASSSIASIGGDVIAGPGIQASLLPGSSHFSGSGSLAGSEAGTLSSELGGEVFTGPLLNRPIGRGTSVDKWNSNQVGGTPITSSGLWNGTSAGGPIGGFTPGNSSSALASILGVSLPTGSGSLRETANIWPAPTPVGPSPLASLNNGSIGGPPPGGMIGGIPMTHGSSLIGGMPIGAPNLAPVGGASGPVGGSYSGKSDIALLQSLLPGVHITSGNEGLAGNSWNHAGPGALGGETLPGWGAQRSSVGPIGHGSGQQNQRNTPIW